MTDHKRRSFETLREVDGLLDAHLQDADIGGRPLANLAAAMAIEYSGAERGALLVDKGKGLEPVLTLEQDLSISSVEASASYDADLIDRACHSLRTQSTQNAIAAPVLLGQVVTCMLYLENRQQVLGADQVQLAEGVATRIGALLRSAALVEELARRTHNVSTLEALGRCLAAGNLRQEHLDQALEGAQSATHSDDAILALVEAPRTGLGTVVRGLQADELEEHLVNWLEQLRATATGEIDTQVAGHVMVEPFWADLVPTGGTEREILGFLAVRRLPEEPSFDPSDRSFFRAVAHLISGALARMEYLSKAAEDPLTEIGSRLALQLGLAEAQTNAVATGRPFSLILVDLDNFKQVNDQHGHLAGDQVLKEFAAALRDRLRSTDSVARYGGDEFVIILPRTEAHQAADLAEELRLLVATKKFGEAGLELTISAGVATASPEATDLQAVMSAADEALYRSKTLGRNRVMHHDELPQDV